MQNRQAPKKQPLRQEYVQTPLDLENPKRNAIMIAAAKLFLERGFEPVTMDSIAAEADVSKRTVYSYFESKAELFTSIMVAHCSSMGGIALPEVLANQDPRKVLTQFGEVFVAMITSPRAIAMQRIVFREAERLPEIGQIFFSAGPSRHIAKLCAYLTQADAEEKLDIRDPEYAALFFMSAVKAPFHLSQLCGVMATPDRKAINQAVKSAVNIFLSAHTPNRNGDNAFPPGRRP